MRARFSALLVDGDIETPQHSTTYSIPRVSTACVLARGNARARAIAAATIRTMCGEEEEKEVITLK